MLPPWPPLWPLYVWSLIYSCRDGEIFMETTNITCVLEIRSRSTNLAAGHIKYCEECNTHTTNNHLVEIFTFEINRRCTSPTDIAEGACTSMASFFSFLCLHKMFEGTSRVFHDNDASEYWTKCIYFPTALPGRKRMKIKKIVKFALRKYKFFYLYSFSSVEVENKAEAEMENVYSNSIIIWRCTNMS